MSEPVGVTVDHRQRQRALDVAASFIVQAPAGSGKTELLIQRMLALLAVAATPEEILAITFTRKAAAEMHKRLLEALEKARNEPAPVEPHALQTWSLARAALARDQVLGWKLLDCPARLQVMTIDSLCAALVRRMPYLARFGEAPAIVEDPAELYRRAAERLLARLEDSGEGCAAIERLLAHLDNQLPLLRNLLVAMLGRRDQWLRHLDPANLATARPDLENALRLQVATALGALRETLSEGLLAELCQLGGWAAGNLAAAGEDHPLAALVGLSAPPAATVTDLPAWLALTHLVLTDRGEARKSVDVRLGFPAGQDGAAREMKRRLTAALEQLRTESEALRQLRGLRHLPATAYADEQWQVLAALIELLPLADRELRQTFQAAGQVDFAEIARGALTALGDDLAPADLLLHLDSRLRHILVDEFQDTSRGQFELLSRLTAGWEPGDGRTLFVVGDPMQSIYRFREAEVGLYLRVRSRGLVNVRLSPLVLQTNFRSQASLVDWFNAVFAQLFPVAEDEMRGAVPYAAATAAYSAGIGPAVTVTCFAGRDDAGEAARVVELIRQARCADPAGSIAVLVRSRTHLAALIPALKGAGLTWQAQEVDPLGNRQVIRDLLALTRALLHPDDRVAWLAVLRAPWCGLGLNDLLALCGNRPGATLWECLAEHGAQPPLIPALAAESAARLAAVVPVLSRGLAAKGRLPLRRLIETAWLGLHGPAGLAERDLADAEQFFTLLEELDVGGDMVRLETLEERLGKLYAAPDPQAGPGLQLMTIHKAKGLEFDTVILPGLGRQVRPPERSLLLWQEQPEPARRGEGLLLAPIPASTAEEHDPTYRAIARIHADKDQLETLRLFYVAATRARKCLHLLGHAERNHEGEPCPAAGSLFKEAWPVLGAAAREHLVDTAAAIPDVIPPGVPLLRLPADWSAPPLAKALPVAVPSPRRASDAGHRQAASAHLSLRSEEGRVIGTIVHAWLERLARDGLEQWPEERLASIRSALEGELQRGGVPRSRVPVCTERVMAALTGARRSPRGSWILRVHRDAACELALTGVIDGTPVHAIIDRTFVDEQGVCWVIDYKTGCPSGEGAVEDFLAEEVERYRGQLNDYRRLMMLQMPQQTVKAALYFPLLDAWREVS